MMKINPTLAIFGMLTVGTVCTLLGKIIYTIQAPSLRGGYAPFEKPWFQVFSMFFGMAACILLDMPKRRESSDQQAHHVWIVSVPALLDLFATACGTVGLLFTSVSVYQMLKGAMLVWTALFSVIFLKKKLNMWNYYGIFLCVAGIVLVGLAGVWGQGEKGDGGMYFGVSALLFGQVIQAAQAVVEEYLLRNLHMSTTRVVAWEGLFGMLHCLLWVFPFLYILPGGDNGHVEDSLDSFYMVSNSWAVKAIVLTDAILMLFYNVFGMEVTNSFSALHRLVIENLRTLFVWLADLLIYYVLSNGKLGEPWTRYSYLQLMGFFFLLVGTHVYNKDTTAEIDTKEEQLPLLDPAVTNEVLPQRYSVGSGSITHEHLLNE